MTVFIDCMVVGYIQIDAVIEQSSGTTCFPGS